MFKLTIKDEHLMSKPEVKQYLKEVEGIIKAAWTAHETDMMCFASCRVHERTGEQCTICLAMSEVGDE